jgi:putative hydrolase of the HAD superfamily
MSLNLEQHLSNKQLIIFDLDQTLVDWFGGEPHLFPDVPNILESLSKYGYKIVLASYNRWAEHYLEKLGVSHYFDMIAIDILNTFDKLDYKKDLLEKILKHFNISPEKALFFDDQKKNVHTGNALGIDSIYLDMNGLTEELFLEGFNSKSVSYAQQSDV